MPPEIALQVINYYKTWEDRFCQYGKVANRRGEILHQIEEIVKSWKAD
jgi:hypothetical protein